MRKGWMFSLLMFFCMACFGQKAVTAAEQKAMIEKVEAAASGINTLQCDFVQEKVFSLLNDKMIAKGVMHFRKPNLLHWEYTTPYTYTFVLNGTKVLLKSKQKKDVIDVRSSQLFQEIAKIMMNSVTGKCLSDKSNFAVTMYKSDSEWQAKLVPQKKNMKQMFSAIVLHIDPSQGVVNKVEMKEKTGDTTEIQLKGITKNGKIDDKVFSID